MQVHWRNPSLVDDATRESVARRLEALARRYPELIDLWIDLDKNTHHRHGAARASIRCQASGAELVAGNEDEEPALALRNALKSFEREVARWRERRVDRRVERPAAPPNLGIVDRVFREEGYGFILTDGGEQVYFHRNALHELEFESLEEGQRVSLNYEPGEKGPQASAVRPAPPGTPAP